MAKIENTVVYPTVTPQADDYVVGTDVSDNNKTVTFLVSDLGGGATILQGLQSVLDESNFATQSIILNGGPGGNGYIDLCQILLNGDAGVAGQVLTSNGAAACATWTTPSGGGSCCSLQDTTNVGSSTTNTVTLAGGNLVMNTTNGEVQLNNGSDLMLSATTEINFQNGSAINDSAGATGTNGQILTIVGGNVTWASAAAASCCSLQDTLTVGNTATGIGINLTATSPLTLDATSNITSSGANTWNGTNTFTADVELDGTVEDGVGSAGVAGQVLSSTGTGVAWVNNTAAPGLQDVLDVNDTAVEDINLTGTIDLTGSLVLGSNTTISANASTGTPGQYLTATATGVEWTSLSTACCTLDDTLAAGNTSGLNIIMTGSSDISAPTMTPNQIVASNGVGTAGQILSSTGTGIEWINNTSTGMTQLFLAGDSGPNQTLTDSDTISVLGGTGLSSITSVTDTVTINLDDTTVVPGTYTAATVTVNQQGQITAASNNTVSDTTYDLASAQNGANSNLNLTGSDGTTDTVQIIAGTNITITDAGSAITIDAASASGMTSFLLAGDTGPNQTITNGNTLTVEGGTGMETAAAAGDKVTITLSDTTVVPGNYLNANIIVNQQGQITSVANGDNSTATFTSAQNGSNVDMTYAQVDPTVNDIVKLVAGTNITLTDNGSNEITIDATGGGTGMTSFDVSANSGATQTITNGNTLNIAQGTGISTVASAVDTVTISNTGVTSLIAGANITLSAATGAVTIASTGGGSSHGNVLVSRPFHAAPLIRTNAQNYWTYVNPIALTGVGYPPTCIPSQHLLDQNTQDPTLGMPIGQWGENVFLHKNWGSTCPGGHEDQTLCNVQIELSHAIKQLRVSVWKARFCNNTTPWVWTEVGRCDFLAGLAGLRETQCCTMNLTDGDPANLILNPGWGHALTVYTTDGTTAGLVGNIYLEYTRSS